MSNLLPRISVITTTWNRASYLPRVYAGLMAQTIRDFEWIVADDGSDDGTSDLIGELAANSQFQVQLIRANVHVGKARMDNEAIQAARGEFIVWCDSDDFFVPDALEAFLIGWESIPKGERGNFVGITALCESCEETLNEEISKRLPFDARISELESVHHMTQDGALFLRAEILKQHKFPEVDLVVPESVVWSELGKFYTRVLTRVVKKTEYKAEHCISFSAGMKYNRGRAYAMATSIRNYSDRKLSIRQLAWNTINYLRYCIHGDIDLKTTIKLWGKNSSLLLLTTCATPALILAFKDKLQKKVIKTHLEFELNSRTAIINREFLM